MKVVLQLWDYNIIYVMPFFCTIATRPPFIYFVMQLRDTYRVDFNTISIFIGGFHFCRLIAIAGALIAPRVSHLVGTTIGLAGFVSLYLTAGTDSLATFAASNMVVGFAEASAYVNIYAKDEYGSDLQNLCMALSWQSQIIGVAIIFGFLLGGELFHFFGVEGIAAAGFVVLTVELVSLH